LLASAALAEGSVAVIDSVILLRLPLSNVAVEAMVLEGVEAVVFEDIVASEACPPKMALDSVYSWSEFCVSQNIAKATMRSLYM
jgi:hypothetical protein